MEWTEVKVIATSEAVEAISNILIENGASGVAIEDDLDIAHYEVDEFGEILDKEKLMRHNEDVNITAYFPEVMNVIELLPEIKSRISQLTEFGLDIGKNEVVLQAIEEEGWADAWKKYYAPKRLTRFLTVVPSWVNYEKEVEDEQLIFLDPGMAFGTGTHPTTRLSLQALESVLRKGEVVLDVGVGSGVLSIAASLLGAKEIFAYDLDEVAVNRAKENFALNPKCENIHVDKGNLLQGVTQKADVIVANILADILILMTKDAYRLLDENGKLILSGIISEKLSMVREEFETVGFVIEQVLTSGEWNALVLSKNKDEQNGMVGG
ncbi:ribosomal protein L11 methyltransferase [Pilibacter termitis]|uniref:Ribosomal protein L11 methyltransferase n=1 Tax=Pilibacter termitis TaxID=263852 RepID=A0A1T4PW73_9ENTE|nr:50S ribosomal protein L11 methyltransferase [Pilibacter termitis]SJZ95742.1 ribosomal protein L11 methyltransferase [Pilibacter termitis]